MKRILFLFPVLALVAGFVSCEKHSPSQTIPGYAEKEAEKKAEKEARMLTPQGGNPDAPTFFPKDQH